MFLVVRICFHFEQIRTEGSQASGEYNTMTRLLTIADFLMKFGLSCLFETLKTLLLKLTFDTISNDDAIKDLSTSVHDEHISLNA